MSIPVHDAIVGLPVLRRCTAEDAEALAQVGAATFLETYAGWLPGKDILAHCQTHHTAESYAELLQRPGVVSWVLEVEDAPVGYLVLTRPDFPPHLLRDGDLELKRIYLFSRFHGLGLARTLLREALAFAKSAGAQRMLVGMHRDNARALAFYRKHGFEQIGQRSFQMGSVWYDDPVLALEL